MLDPPLIKYENLYVTRWLFDLQSTVLVYNAKITKINGIIVQKHIHLTTFLDKTDFICNLLINWSDYGSGTEI